MEAVNLITIITIAFLGSFGHCVGMCGGIVLAYTATKVDEKWGKTKQAFAHLSYSTGRILTYTLLGVIFGYLGGVATFNNTSNGVLLVVAGIFMLLTGFSLIGKIKFLTLIEHSFSKSRWYQESFKKLLHSNSLISFFILGMLNGLLPCGFVYFFAITAASTGSAFWGGVVMFIFGISTIPALFSLGFFVGLFKRTELRNTIIKLSAILVIAYGCFTIYNGYKYLTQPERTLLQCHES